jgi:hypothetical protein
MSRPKPNIIIENVDKSTYKSEQILQSEGIWAVYYDNTAINLRSQHLLAGPSPKYKKVSFSNSGHAISLAKKLNKLYKTDKFTVVLLKIDSQIYP